MSAGGRSAAMRAGGHTVSRKLAGLPLPAWLIALSIVPLLGGAARLLQLAGGDAPAPEDLRFAMTPMPVTLHIATAAFYCLVGAFQFDDDLRRRRPALHRVLGRMAFACGRLVGLTGLWMTLASEIPAGLQGELLRIVRVAVAAGMVACLGSGGPHHPGGPCAAPSGMDGPRLRVGAGCRHPGRAVAAADTRVRRGHRRRPRPGDDGGMAAESGGRRMGPGASAGGFLNRRSGRRTLARLTPALDRRDDQVEGRELGAAANSSGPPWHRSARAAIVSP